jgi:hypothetical protein
VIVFGANESILRDQFLQIVIDLDETPHYLFQTGDVTS